MITKEQFKKDMFRCIVTEMQADYEVNTFYGDRKILEGDRLYTAVVKYVLGEVTVIGLVDDEIDRFLEDWVHEGVYGAFSGPMNSGTYHLFTEKPNAETE